MLDFANGHKKYIEKGVIHKYISNPTVRRVLPVWIFVVLLLAAMAIINPRLILAKNLSMMLMLASLIAMAGVGQGIVILTGGLDLSLPWIAACSGIITTWIAKGSNHDLWWLVPMVLCFGACIGLINGLGVVGLGINCVIMTMGMNAVLEGITMILTSGTPYGLTPPALRWFIISYIGPIQVSVIFIVVVAIVVSLILSRTTYGRKIYAIGNSRTVATLCGIRAKLLEISVYVICGISSAMLGMMLVGFIGQSYLGMGNQYQLTSITAVAIGGASILGGKGHYIGTLGGAILLSMVSVLLTSLLLPEAVRNIIFGIIILLAVISAREKVEGH